MKVSFNYLAIGILLNVLTIGFSKASEGSDAYKKLMEIYSSAKTFNVSFDMLLISDVEPDETIKSCKIIKSGNKYYSNIGNNQIVYVAPYAIQVSEEEKILYCTNFVTLPNNTAEMPFYKELLNKPENFKVADLGEGLSKLTIKTNNFDVYRIEIIYDRNNLLIKKYSTFLQEYSPFDNDKILKSAIICTYNKQELLDTEKSFQEFDWNRYIIVKNGKISPIASFARFQFINDFKTQAK
jgi:predicted transcriptional regulator